MRRHEKMGYFVCSANAHAHGQMLSSYESMREMVSHGRDLNNNSECKLIKGLR